MTTTRKRPPKTSQPKQPRHPAHPKPPQSPDSNENYPVEYQQFITEWNSILNEPPRTIEQVRQEYDDALSFLLMLESRINWLEQSEWLADQIKTSQGVTPTVSPVKLIYVSARSRSAKERNAERLARRSEWPDGPKGIIIEPREFIPPYIAEQTPNPLLLFEFLKWAVSAWDKSAVKRSLSDADQSATMIALRQMVRCLSSYIQVGVEAQ